MPTEPGAVTPALDEWLTAPFWIPASYIAFAAAPICGHDRGPQLVVMRFPQRQNGLRKIKNLALFSI